MPVSNNASSHKKPMKRQAKTEGLGDSMSAVADGKPVDLKLRKGPRGPLDGPSPNLKKK
jgi:hypothetical protein